MYLIGVDTYLGLGKPWDHANYYRPDYEGARYTEAHTDNWWTFTDGQWVADE